MSDRPATAHDAAGAASGRLAHRVLHFGRLLRRAGLALPTERIVLALQALPIAGLASRQDFHDVLAACLLDRIEHRELFDQAFDLYWREPDPTGLLQATGPAPDAPAALPASRRAAEAMQASAQGTVSRPPPPPPPSPTEAEAEVDASTAPTAHERLRRADFDAMSTDEWRQAQSLLRRLAPLFESVRTRRAAPAAGPGAQSRLDGRATLRAMARHGGELWQLHWRRPRVRPAPLVVLADISGSMSRYSRMLLHFTHALGHAEARVESFVFGTRLTRTTRALRQRDPDVAVARVMREVRDWSGGTRISECLREFNRRWVRRVLAGRATVLLISDGLEHGSADDPRCTGLRFEMERLHKSCRRLVWLNPLLRFAAFEPRAAGIRAMLPHVDLFLPAHNLLSLEHLARVLAAGTPAAAAPRAAGTGSPFVRRRALA